MNKNRVFHSVTIRGVRFDGRVEEINGPTLSSKRGWTPLVVCALRNFDPTRRYDTRPSPSGWWVIKYYDEIRLNLTDFGEPAIRRLADEFGICVLDGGDNDPHPLDSIRLRMFMASPAWSGLCRWVSDHPRLAKQLAASDDYVPGWLTRALIHNEFFSRLDGATAH